METKNCIVCGKLATRWSGHIHTEIGNIISGWCDEHEHSKRPRFNKCTSVNPRSCGGAYLFAEIELTDFRNDPIILNEMEDKTTLIQAKVKPNWAEASRPAIWYCESGGETFTLKQSEYKDMYEVTEGEHKGMVIEKSAVEIITENNKSW